MNKEHVLVCACSELRVEMEVIILQLRQYLEQEEEIWEEKNP